MVNKESQSQRRKAEGSEKVKDRHERQKEKVEDMQRKTCRGERQKVEYRETRTQGKKDWKEQAGRI